MMGCNILVGDMFEAIPAADAIFMKLKLLGMSSFGSVIMLRGQEEIWQLMFGFVDSMALKCAIELGIADIIKSQGGHPLTLSQIASGIDSPCVQIDYLARIMRFLVRKDVFTAHCDSSRDGEVLYGLNEKSHWLLRDSEMNLAPLALMENHPWQLLPWHYFGICVKEGASAFEKAHGCNVWDMSSKNPEFNRLFNDGMACVAKIVMKAFLSRYGDGLKDIEALVDVGGGTGAHLAEIVRAYPHIKGINFDLPHVVATAPEYDGVKHVVGDMFDAIPAADAIFMKWVLHDWEDEHCVRILKNCRRAIPEKTGKLIIMEIVLQPEDNDPFGDMRMVFDLAMIAHAPCGKERTEPEWKTLLARGGFPRYNIIKIHALPSIIEAFPE